MSPLERWLLRGALWLLLAAALLGGGFLWGLSTGNARCDAKAGNANAKVEAKEDTRDANIDAIGAATGAAVASALAHNQVEDDESTDRIRTVYVPGPCRDVDAGILRELDAARAAANAALGIGVRPDPARAGAADPAPAPGP